MTLPIQHPHRLARRFAQVALTAAVMTVGLNGPAQAQTAASAPAAAPAGAPIFMTFLDDGISLDRVRELARPLVSPAQVQALREAGVSISVLPFSFKSGDCYIEVGTAVAPKPDRMQRISYANSWQVAERRPQETPAATCERAFVAALKTLADERNGYFSPDELKIAFDRTSDSAKPRFAPQRREKGVLNHMTQGLSDSGKQAIADTLSDRWTTVLDHRKFSVYAYLRDTKTIEGHPYCLMLTGITAYSPDGKNAYVPPNLKAQYRVPKAGEGSCVGGVFSDAMTLLRDGYEKDLPDLYKYGTEAGQTYPKLEDLQKAVAKFDADQAAKVKREAQRDAQRPAQRPVVQSTTTSRNVLRCRNDCVNGNCLRTFEDGRQERWQAPRRYNPMTSNWDWDTTTNACGG